MQMEYIIDLNVIIVANEKQLLIFQENNMSSPVKTFNFKHSFIKLSWFMNDMIIIFADQKFTIVEINSLPKMNDNDITYFVSNMSNLFNCAINPRIKCFLLASSEGKCFKGIYKNNKQINNFTSYYYNNNDTRKDDYFVFVAQSKKQGDTSHLYQINSILLNPRSDQFLLTTGTNGDINLWDLLAKNKISQYQLTHCINTAEIS